jgi:hypothetical protein
MKSLAAVFTPQSVVSKLPGSTFGATLTFTYQGPAITVWVGIGLAFAEAIGHNNNLYYAMIQKSIPACSSPTIQTALVNSTIPSNAQVPSTYDAQKFISKTQPVVGAVAPDDFGINNWDDDVYSIAGSNFSGLSAVYT